MRSRDEVRPLAIDFRGDASLEDVLDAVRIAYEATGCAPCGRLSIFLRAQEVSLPAVDRLEEIQSVLSVQELGPQISTQSLQAGIRG